MARFQVKLSGNWENYMTAEDKVLKRAFMAGYPCVKFTFRQQDYKTDFKHMVQTNLSTGKVRELRAPHKWQQPKKPLVPPGLTMTLTVPPGSPGKRICVPHPKARGVFLLVGVPQKAKEGQAMLVPVPHIEDAVIIPLPADVQAPVAPTALPDVVPAPPLPTPSALPSTVGSKMIHTPTKRSVAKENIAPDQLKSTEHRNAGAKAAAGILGGAAIGGVAVTGAILGGHIAEHGWDATVEAPVDFASDAIDAAMEAFEDAGEAIEDFTVDAGEFIDDAADGLEDLLMELF